LLKYFFYGASFCEIAPLKFSEHQLLQSAFRLLCTTIILQDLKTRGDGMFGLNKVEIRMNAAIPALAFGLSATIM
jgi:hypothetical protein